MKNIFLAAALTLSSFGFSQVLIGAKATASPLVTNDSVSLEFGVGNRGVLLPWVFGDLAPSGTGASTYTQLSGNTAVDGTLIFDLSDNRVKFRAGGAWVSLSDNNTTGTTGGASPTTIDTTGTTIKGGVNGRDIQDNRNNAATAKAVISKVATTADTADGILVLSDDNRAMILPKVASPHLNIINPDAGMIVYDTTKKQLAVFNGKVWSFWKP